MAKPKDDGSPYWTYMRQKSYEFLALAYERSGRNWSEVARELSLNRSGLQKTVEKLKRYGFTFDEREYKGAAKSHQDRVDGAAVPEDHRDSPPDGSGGTAGDLA